MSRAHGSTASGDLFPQAGIDEVWSLGSEVEWKDKREWRRDASGRLIRRSDYGNTASPHGWEIDHIKPVSLGGGDELSNLQPLQWRLNRQKSDQYPWSPMLGPLGGMMHLLNRKDAVI